MHNSFKLLIGLGLLLCGVQCTQKEDPILVQQGIDKKIIENYVAEKGLVGSYLTEGVYKVISQQGAGESPLANEALIVHSNLYLLNGTLLKADTLFYQHAQGFFFYGWEYSVNTMRQGEISSFLIPSNFAFGSTAKTIEGGTIPANSNLRLDIELVKIIPTADIAKAYAAYDSIPNTKISPSGVVYTFTGTGTGDTTKVGQTATVKYEGSLLSGGIFDQSSAFQYKYGETNLIKGWQEILPHLKKGDKVTMIVPSEAAYGNQVKRDENNQIIIPANAVLIFKIEIVDIK